MTEASFDALSEITFLTSRKESVRESIEQINSMRELIRNCKNRKNVLSDGRFYAPRRKMTFPRKNDSSYQSFCKKFAVSKLKYYYWKRRVGKLPCEAKAIHSGRSKTQEFIEVAN
jgi:hypothetical protein